MVTPVVGLPQVSGWAQVTANPSASAYRFVCAFSVAGDSAGNLGRNLADKISQAELFSTEEALAFFNSLSDLAQEQNVEFSGSAVFLGVQEALFMSLKGAIILKRSDKVGKLLQADSDMAVLVGKYQPDDTIVLSTQNATAFLPEIEQKFKTGFETDTIITSVVPGIHNQEDSSTVSLAFVVVEELDAVAESLESGQEEHTTLSGLSQINTSPESLKTTTATDNQIPKEDSEGTLSEEATTDEEQAVAKPLVQAQEVKATNSSLLREIGVHDSSVAEPVSKKQPNYAIFQKLWQFLVIIIKNLWLLLSKITHWFYSSFSKIPFSEFRPAKIKARLETSKLPSLDKSQAQRKKLMFVAIVGAVLVGLLATFVISVFHKHAQELSATQEVLSTITTQINEASARAEQDPLESREKVKSSVQKLESMLVEAQNTKKPKKVTKIISEALDFAKTTETDISGKIEVNALHTFYDLRLISPSFVTSSAYSDGQTAVFLDEQQKQLVTLDLETKKTQELSLDLPIRSLAVSSGKVFLLADGIYELDLGSDSPKPQKIIDEGDSNRDAKIIRAYDAYLYVFNDTKRNIYRYTRSGGEEKKYSDPIGWVQAVKGLDYNLVSDVAIDGDVWLTTQSGQLLKLTSGRLQDFSPKGLSLNFESLLKIATDSQQENLYVLEPQKKRLVILAKDGQFIKEVTSNSLASTTDILVSEKLQSAYAVSGSIIYEIPL